MHRNNKSMGGSKLRRQEHVRGEWGSSLDWLRAGRCCHEGRALKHLGISVTFSQEQSGLGRHR